MSPTLDRRAFLARLGRAGLVAPLAPLAGCVEGGGDPAPEASTETLPDVTRPIVRPWEADAYRIDSPLRELPMAYVSMGRREVFVDYAFRDRSNWILDAHISVSTGLWRIPLPGDPVGQPITPGDTLREFEELDMAEWDPGMTPALGDFRIRRGRPAPVRVEVGCVPVGATDAWISAGPWEIRQCAGVLDDACREDFLPIGSGVRHPLRGCDTEGAPVEILAWSCRA